MNSKLAEVLLDLGKNPEKLEDLKIAPDKFLSDAGLSPEEIEIVKSGDAVKLRAAVSGDVLDGDVVVVVVVVIAA